MTDSFLHLTKRIVLLVILSVATVIPNYSIAQSREYLLKAGYIEKFTHFVEWPVLQDNNDSVFEIAVIGEDELGPALEEMFSLIKVKNLPVKITFINSADEINNSMILVISGEITGHKLAEILNYTTGKQILTISENTGYGEKGVIINMFTDDNFIRYEVNRSTLLKSGLKINSMLLNYAVIIKTDD